MPNPQPHRPGGHGRDHMPGGVDAIFTGPWIEIGSGDLIPGSSTVLAPDFENGWANIVGDDFAPMAYRLLLGPANHPGGSAIVDSTGAPNPQVGLEPFIVVQKSIEIAGDVEGGGDGTTVFTLPEIHRMDRGFPYPSHDNAGVYVPCRLYKDGRFVRGAV